MGIRTSLGLKKASLKRSKAISIDRFRGLSPRERIPRVLNFIWVGDDAKRPDRCIDSWRRHHPDWEVRVWGNDEYKNCDWRLKRHMEAIWPFELCGVADLMRWEILAKYGGFTIDADSFCLRSLSNLFLEAEAVCASGNEILKPGLKSIGFMGSVQNNKFFTSLVDHLDETDDLFLEYRFLRRPKRKRAWKATGPQLLTDWLNRTQYPNMTVLPSHFFYPDYKRGKLIYSGGSLVFAYQAWGSTFSDYSFDETIAPSP